jgi:beta-1,3-galactosyltransferase 1/2/3/4/5/7/8
MKPKNGGLASDRRLLSRRILILCFLSFFLGILVTDL